MNYIIYPNGTGGINIVVPTGSLSIAEVARKDVPAGLPYRFITTVDIPADGSSPELWTADFSAPDGHGIGAWAWFIEQRAAQYAALLPVNQPPPEASQAVADAYAAFAAAIQDALAALDTLPATDPSEADRQAFGVTIPAAVQVAGQNLAVALLAAQPEPEPEPDPEPEPEAPAP